MKRFKERMYPDDAYQIATKLNDSRIVQEIHAPIRSVIETVMNSASIWKWRFHNTNNYPLVGIYPTKGFCNWKSNRKIHSIIFNGVLNEYIMPALCKISILTNNFGTVDDFDEREKLIKLNNCPEWIEKRVIEVVGQYSLNTKFVYYQEMLPMTDAYEIFDTKDKAIDNDENLKDHKELVENMKSMNSIHQRFKMLVGGFFKDFFDVGEQPDNEDHISLEYANKVYEIFEKAYDIHIQTKDNLKNIDYPVIIVATKPTTMNILLAHTLNKPLFRGLRPKHIIKNCITTIPLLLAGMHHSVFRQEYLEIKNTIMAVKAKNDELQEENVKNFVKSW